MRNLHYLDKYRVALMGNMGDEYYIHQKISGRTEFRARYDGKEADNGHLHNGLDYTDIGKFAYCTECRNSVFRFRK